MAYAPHTNTDVHQHLIANATVVPPLVLGVFVEKSYGKTFEYAERRPRAIIADQIMPKKRGFPVCLRKTRALICALMKRPNCLKDNIF